MKITGVIVLDKMEGRQEPWVTKKVEKDYFLALKITRIDSHEITSCDSAFKALKSRIPSIVVGGDEVNDLFQTPVLPRGAKDIVHVTLGNFGDFRVNRNLANDVDMDKVALAEEFEGQEITFDIADDAFEVVSTSAYYDLLITIAKITKTENVGFKRDTIISLSPSEQEQSVFQKISATVFQDTNFKLWNGKKEPIPYNITIAQTDGLNAKLAQANEKLVNADKSDSVQLAI